MRIPEPEPVTVLPADVKSADEWDFDRTKLIDLFKRRNYKIHLSS